MRIFSALVRTRARAFMSAVFSAGLLTAHLAWAIPFIDHKSSSAGLNLVLIVVWMLLALAVAFFGAVLAAELVFGKRWRETYFDVKPADSDDDDAGEPDLAALTRSMRVQTFKFSALMVLFAAGTTLGSNSLCGDFFGRYQRTGYVRTVFRGDNDRLKISAIRRISRQYDPALREQAELVATQLDAASPAVRREAVRGLSRTARQIRSALTSLARTTQDLSLRWETRLSGVFHRQIAPKMRRVIESSDDEATRIAAWFFLGSMARDQVVEAWGVAKSRVDRDAPEWVAMLVIAGQLARVELLPDLLPEVGAERDETVRVAALWAVGRILDRYDPPRRPGVPIDPSIEQAVRKLAELSDDPSLAVRCAVFDAFRLARDARHDDLFFDVLKRTPADATCPAPQVHVPDGPPITLIREAPLRIKVLEAIASIAVQNRRVQHRLDLLLSERSRYDEDFLSVVRDVLRMARESEEGRP